MQTLLAALLYLLMVMSQTNVELTTDQKLQIMKDFIDGNGMRHEVQKTMIGESISTEKPIEAEKAKLEAAQ